MSPPAYEKWTEYVEFRSALNQDWEAQKGTAMIVIIWLFWILNIMIALVILLNFLIAIISQSYE